MKISEPIIIGIDLDNTIINYQTAFYTSALESGCIGVGFPKDKKKIRDHIRHKEGGEKNWQILQSMVYGEKINNALLFKGVKGFLRYCNRQNIPVYIVSHKTKYPKQGKLFDLREAALSFLCEKGIFSNNMIQKDKVFFESNREDKIQRIKKLKCTFFIDDLIETFMEPCFPEQTYKVLFDPGGNQSDRPSAVSKVLKSWSDILYYIDSKISRKKIIEVVRSTYPNKSFQEKKMGIKQLYNGRNSKISAVRYGDKRLIAKQYINDDRDRMKREFQAYTYFAENSFKNVPLLLGSNFERRIMLFEYIEGDWAGVQIPNNKDLDTIVSLILKIKETQGFTGINFMPAADAFLSPEKSLWVLDRSIDAFHGSENTDCKKEFDHFFKNELVPNYEMEKTRLLEFISSSQFFLTKKLDKQLQVLNPSDLGFHNMIRDKNQNLYFLDFEYFGWDDPVKMILDFIIHPGMKLKTEQKAYFFNEMLKVFQADESLKTRIKMYLPIIILKWVLIILNVFKREYIQQRDKILTQDISTIQKARLISAKALLKKKEIWVDIVEGWQN